MNKIIAGLVILAIGLWAMYAWWWFIVDILRGLIAIALILNGLILIALGLKNTGKGHAGKKMADVLDE